MIKILKYISLMFLVTLLTGCSWYVRYPSVGVRAESRTEVRTECYWEYVNPRVRVKRCKKVRVRIR